MSDWLKCFQSSTQASQKFVKTITEERTEAKTAIEDLNVLYLDNRDSIKKLKMALKKGTELAK